MIQDAINLKPSFNEWDRWVGYLTERLTDAAHVYNAPPYHDAFLLERDRQEKLARTVSILRSIHVALENHETLSQKASVEERDNVAVERLCPHVKDALAFLPFLSADMQFLLKSPWAENCTGRTATKLFRGEGGRLDEGIGSGSPEHGRLPLVLTKLLEREEVGETRAKPEIQPANEQTVRRTALLRRRASSSGSAGRID
jgi:hypothetical protein